MGDKKEETYVLGFIHFLDEQLEELESFDSYRKAEKGMENITKSI